MEEVNFPPQRPSAKLKGNELVLGHSRIPLKILSFGRAMSKPEQLEVPVNDGDSGHAGQIAGGKGGMDHPNGK